MRKLIHCLTVVLLVAVSCKEVSLPEQIINLDTESIVAPSFGADYNIVVESNTSWELTAIKEDWLASDFENTVGNSNFTLKVSANESVKRSAEIIVRSVDGAVVKTISLTQLSGNGDGPISIASIRALEKLGDSYVFPMGSIAGFVSINRENGNFPENTIFIQDSFTEKLSGIAVYCEKMPAFEQGSQVEVELAGATLKRSDEGILTVYPAEPPVSGECSLLEITPVSLEFDDIATGKYESMLVQINKFQPTEEYIGEEFVTNPMMENRAGQKIRMTVRPDALFAESTYGQGSGTVTGIVGGLVEGRPSILPQSKDAVAFGHFRIGSLPGIKKLPYAFSFYCDSQTDGDTKYINYTPLTWLASTKLLSGTVAEDKDINVGAYLEMTAYASDISKTLYSAGKTYCWAEAGANDNINSTGFVSPDGKTTPTSECGWWLTVPLQTDLPSKFNVLFGLAGGEWSISTWKLSYSHDKLDWIEAGDVTIGNACTNGSYYYHFCVTVTPDSPFEADNNLYLKITPYGTDACKPENLNADGHGSSCFIRLHSAIIIQDASVPTTTVPEGAVLFEPFDNLTQGADYFYGERNAGFANYCGSEISAWTSTQKRGMDGTNVYERPGYAQIGYVNDETTGSRNTYTGRKGSLTTAPLGKSGDFTLSFKAGAYRTPAIRTNASKSTPDVASPDITDAVIIVNGGGTINGATKVAVSSLPTGYAWKEYSFSIEGATASTTLTFTSEPEDGQFSRWFIDEILVK